MNGNDAKEQAANAAHVHAVEQAAAQALVEEKESESRFRHYGKGPWAAAISALAVIFSLFQMYASTFSAFDAMTLRSWHIIFLLMLGCSRLAISSSIIRKSLCAAAISCLSTTSWPPSA